MHKEMIVSLMISVCLIILIGFVFFIVYIVSLHQRSRVKFLLEMEELKNSFKYEILQSELEMQEQTFEKISMEIHENVGQMLSVSKLNLDMIRDAPNDVLEKIQYSVNLMTEAINDLRNLASRLDADAIRQDGLCGAIEEYVARLRKITNVEILFTTHGNTNVLPVEKELILFRILQEATNNILNHAGAGLIIIELILFKEQLQLGVRDNGKGFDLSVVAGKNRERSGIQSMQKRTAMIEGSFTLESEIGKGTQITIQLPVRQALPAKRAHHSQAVYQTLDA
jgi:two-component system, NarL family, sensor kinase